ncbi:TetR/AcrR family transcriptional regulator [Nocardia spumae]|uniref:TetR/AcrR family transcriptional regulator n=1 Tax=Nocardia spumae TaxID=2887190 RepID=UPI001D15727E|nr:TetR/AcrR family transcriptional regulator [Nocardia spumae]
MTTANRQYGGRAVTERRAERRQRFVVAATKVFAEKGYANCSLADVCAAAGLSKRQFYEEFQTREDVLIAAYDRVQDEAAAAVMRSLGSLPAHDPAAAMAVVLSAYLESITADPYRAKLAFIEVVGASDRMEQHRRDRRHGWVTLLEMVVVPIAGPGARLRGGAALTASVLIGAVNGLAHEWLLMRPRAEVGELTDLLIPVALSLIDI